MTSTHSRIIATSLVLVALLCASPSFANPTEAARRFQTGLELLQRGRAKLALRMFREAQSLAPQPLFSLYEGVARIELGEWRAGAEAIVSALPRTALRDTKLRARLIAIGGKLCGLPERDRPLSTFLILQRLRGDAHLACLLKVAKEGRDAAQRIAAIEAIGALRATTAIDELEKVFRATKNSAVQDAVARVVASFRTRQSVILLKEWSETEPLKYWALLGLAYLGHADALINWDWLIMRAPLAFDEVSALLAILGLKEKAALVALYALEQTTQRKHPSKARWLERLRRFLPGLADNRKRWRKAFERGFGRSPAKGLETLKSRHPTPALSLFSAAPERFSGLALATGFSWVERGRKLLKIDGTGKARLKKEIGQNLHTLRAFGNQLLASSEKGLVLFDTNGKQLRSLSGMRLVATRGQEIFVQSGRDLLRIDEHSHSRKIPLPAITQATIHATETTIFVAGRLGSEWVVSSLERSTLTSRWSRKLPIAEGDHAIWLTPQSAEVVTLAISGLRTRIYGITAGTGVTRWLYRLPELQGRQVILGRPVVAKNGALIVAAESIYALSAEGHLLWRSAPFGVRLVATCANGTIFASDGHHLWELDGAGAIRTVYRSFEHGRDHFSQLVVGNGEVVLRGVSEIRVFRISGITAARTPVAFARDPL